MILFWVLGYILCGLWTVQTCYQLFGPPVGHREAWWTFLIWPVVVVLALFAFTLAMVMGGPREVKEFLDYVRRS